jgi:hypothetical protein
MTTGASRHPLPDPGHGGAIPAARVPGMAGAGTERRDRAPCGFLVKPTLARKVVNSLGHVSSGRKSSTCQPQRMAAVSRESPLKTLHVAGERRFEQSPGHHGSRGQIRVADRKTGTRLSMIRLRSGLISRPRRDSRSFSDATLIFRLIPLVVPATPTPAPEGPEGKGTPSFRGFSPW